MAPFAVYWFVAPTALPHEFLRQPQSPMCPHYAERGDVTVLYAVGGVFLHFRQDVADDLGRVVGGLLRP